MCLFTYPNRASAKAYAKGVVEFECGACPECMQKKSRLWALRCGMQARIQEGVMVTLTYDTYKVKYGKETAEENPTDPTISLSKRDCQLFMKRLRKHFYPAKIKYLITAERGKRTHRAHYHALLFGVRFDDLIKYKKSDRGNWIYKSRTLEKIWQKGICTVDCINLNAKTARYCTKYCSKDAGVDDTFMLFSHGIGEEELLRTFNGKSYWIDGREYSIPRQIWSKVIEKRYDIDGYSRYTPAVRLYDVEKSACTIYKRRDKYIQSQYQKYNYWHQVYCNFLVKLQNYRKDSTRAKYEHKKNAYKKRCDDILISIDNAWYNADYEVTYKYRRFFNSDYSQECGRELNQMYQDTRDKDAQYNEYLEYWSAKAQTFLFNRPTVEERILALPDDKYRGYKTKALLSKQKQYSHKPFMPPRSNCHGFDNHKKEVHFEKTFADPSRHYTANDTNKLLMKKARLKVMLVQVPWEGDEEKIFPTLFGKDIYSGRFTRHQSLANS